MQRESSGGGLGTVVAFLSGLAVGLLFAQKPGSETRGQISDLMSKGRRKGEELLGRGLGSETNERGAEQVERATEGDEQSHYESGKYT